MTDDQRWDQIEHMPYVMEHVIGSGVRFDNAFATTPICCPSRASFLTGQYAHHHGIWNNGGAPFFDASSTVAVWLESAGYQTALIGKYLLDNGKLAPEIPAGWDTWPNRGRGSREGALRSNPQARSDRSGKSGGHGGLPSGFLSGASHGAARS